MLAKDEIAAIVRREIQDAQGYDSDVLARKRADALDYYQGLMAAPHPSRSQIVSTDVADVVHALLARAIPILKTSIIEFEPNGEDDEQQAQLETDFTRHKIEQSDGWAIISQAAHDAFLIGNGWVKAWVDTEPVIEREMYPPLSEDEKAIIYGSQSDDLKITIEDTDTASIVSRETEIQSLVVEAIPPEELLYSAAPHSGDISELRFICERKLKTGSELLGEGIDQDVIDQIPIHTDEYWFGIRAREGQYKEKTAEERGGKQKATVYHEVFCCYVDIDVKESGAAEKYYIEMGGAEILDMYEVDYHPFVTGSPSPMPHRVTGQGMFEMVRDIQDSKTHILRNYMDNLEVANLGRTAAVEGQVNMEDLLDGRVNGVVRIKNPNAVMPLPFNDTGAQSIQGLNYLDEVRSQRGASSLELNDANAQLMKSSAVAAAGQRSDTEKMAGWYAGNITNTLLKGVFKLVHKTCRTQMEGEQQGKIRGEWVKTDPSNWKERKVCNVLIGMTHEERGNRLAGLTALIQQQAAILQSGGDGILTDNDKIYNAAADWIRAADLGQPEEYLIDPKSKDAQQRKQSNQEQSKQQSEQMLKVQQELITMQQQLEKYKHDSELKFKYYDANMDAELKEAEITGKNVVEIEKINAEDQRAEDERLSERIANG